MTQDEINAVKKAAEKMRKQESDQDEVIRFAIQCRLVTTGNCDGLYMDALTEFAKLVAAKERQACANLIEEYPEWVGINAKREIANAIKARGKQA
jgi:N-methylhydantoinase A/oxoprolinase/acetone carboxylase beta subunit